MPEINLNTLETNQLRSSYIETDRSVNIRKNLDEQEKVQQSGLSGIEIRKQVKQLGKHDFLQLLIAQLSHQDPTNPIQDQQFIAQMAQFSSLEQMQNVSGEIQKMSGRQSFTLVGKFIIGKDYQSNEDISGIAQAIFYDNDGKAFVRVGKSAVAVDDVRLIGEPSAFREEYGGEVKQSPQSSNSPVEKTAIKKPGENEKIESKELNTKKESQNLKTEDGASKNRGSNSGPEQSKIKFEEHIITDPKNKIGNTRA